MNIDDIRSRATITVPEAGALLGIGRDAAYAAAGKGEIPILRLGRRLVVPVPALLAMLGVEVAPQPPERRFCKAKRRSADDSPHYAMPGSDFCRVHAGHSPYPKET